MPLIQQEIFQLAKQNLCRRARFSYPATWGLLGRWESTGEATTRVEGGLTLRGPLG